MGKKAERIHRTKVCKTWMDKQEGDSCIVCSSPIARGHRYYMLGKRGVIHWCCVDKLQD